MLSTIIDLIESQTAHFTLSARRQELARLTLARSLSSDYLWNTQYSNASQTTGLEREAIATGPERASGCRTLDPGERLICTLVPVIPTRTRLNPSDLKALREHFSMTEVTELLELVGFNLMLIRAADLSGADIPATRWLSMSDAAAPAYEDHGGHLHHVGSAFRAPYWGNHVENTR